jgi:hypothetical protein
MCHVALAGYLMLLGKNKPLDPNKDEQYTPKWLFDRMGIVFDLDVAAPIGGAPYVPAHRHYTREQDGLVQPWEGFVYMNPPYSKAKPWVEKFIAHGQGIALLPFSKALWMIDIWNKSSAVSPVYDVKFHLPDGKNQGIFMPVALFGMGNRAKEILIKAKISKVR